MSTMYFKYAFIELKQYKIIFSFPSYLSIDNETDGSFNQIGLPVFTEHLLCTEGTY